MLQTTLVDTVPIALGALAGVLCERVAVVNIAIEGMLLAEAFTGAVVGSLAGGPVGLTAAVAVGGLSGLLLAVLVVTYRVDQIIAGVAINLLVLGLTSYASSHVLTTYRELNNAPVFASIEIPLLSDLPIVGPILFQQNIFVYGALDRHVLSLPHARRPQGPRRRRAFGGRG